MASHRSRAHRHRSRSRSRDMDSSERDRPRNAGRATRARDASVSGDRTRRRRPRHSRDAAVSHDRSGYRRRRSSARAGRDYGADYSRDRARHRGRSMKSRSRGRDYMDERDRGWFKQPRRHAVAAHEGWGRRKKYAKKARASHERGFAKHWTRTGRDAGRDRGWTGDRRRHAQAASRGWHLTAKSGWHATHPHYPNEDTYHGPLYSTSGAARKEGYVPGRRRGSKKRSSGSRKKAKYTKAEIRARHERAFAGHYTRTGKKPSRSRDYGMDDSRDRTTRRRSRGYRHSRFGYE